MSSFFIHLDSIGIKHPVYVPCVEQAATHQVNYNQRNKYIGHSQSLSGIGDTIIPDHRVHVFCDTNYEGNGEICLKSVFSDTADLIEHVGIVVLNQFLSSPPHKRCLESYHDYYGIGITIHISKGGQVILYATVVYAKNLELYNPRFPRHYSINKDAEANYRKRYKDCTIIRN